MPANTRKYFPKFRQNYESGRYGSALSGIRSLGKTMLLLCCLFGVLPALRSQNSPLIVSENPRFLKDIGVADYLITASSSLKDVVASGGWKVLDSLTKPAHPHYMWVRLEIKNDKPSPGLFHFNIPHADSIVCYIKRGETIFSRISGPFVSPAKWLHPENPGIIPIQLNPSERCTLYFRLWSYEGRPFSVHSLRVQPEAFTNDHTLHAYREHITRLEFNGFFLGAVTFTMLFFLFMYIKIRERVFLAYSLYLLGAGIYGLVVKTLPFSPLAKQIGLDYPLTYQLGEPVQFFFFAAYFWFGQLLLDMDKKNPGLNKALNCVIGILATSGIALLVLNLLRFDYLLQREVYVWSRLAILVAGIVILVWIGIAVKSPVKWFLIAGSSFFFTGGLLSVIVDPKSQHLFFGATQFSTIYFFKGGMLLECLCFGLALGYKMRIVQLEKNKASAAYIGQLELNRKMAATEKSRLEEMVVLRTSEVMEKNKVIEEQREKQLRNDYEKKLAVLEMTALRSQMNPHFIFNSLNSIRYQILKNDFASATDYLTRFSKLLRQILENSREHVISLTDELEMVKLYLQIESLRFDHNFRFGVETDPGIDADDVLVPAMILQPFVENALKHGLMNSTNAGKEVMVRIIETKEGLRFEIQDNGVGREKAEKLRKEKGGWGLKITEERIALFNQNYTAKIRTEIHDIFSDDIAEGTLIIINYSY